MGNRAREYTIVVGEDEAARRTIERPLTPNEAWAVVEMLRAGGRQVAVLDSRDGQVVVGFHEELRPLPRD